VAAIPPEAILADMRLAAAEIEDILAGALAA
jgi:hypothetical protein